MRKLELKKQKVVEKIMRHDAQVLDRKAQQQQAIEVKRELNLRMVEERREMKQAMQQIKDQETMNAEKALAKYNQDGSLPVPKKKAYRNNNLFKTDGDTYYGASGGNGW